MKKLLSLLSVLTISGTAVPTTIAAIPYRRQKQENLNSDINYQQKNNLEKLNRNKRNSKNNISEIITKFIGESDSFNNFGVALNNKIYSASDVGKVYEYNPATGQQKVVIKTNGFVSGSGIALNNRVYFGSDDLKVYEYNTDTEQQKIINTDGIAYSYESLNNKLYFGLSSRKVCEYNPATGQQKVVFNTENKMYSGLILNYTIYIGSNNEIYGYDPLELI